MAEAETTSVPDLSKSLSLPVGAFSPLWLAFAGAAASGAAFFWMSRWMKPVNLEAQLATDLPVDGAAVAVAELAEPAVETLETAIETAGENAAEQATAFGDALAPVEPAPVAIAESVETAQAAFTEVAEAAAEAPVAILEAVADPAPAFADDLTRLVGIGPKLAASLGERGVTTFAQIAAWTGDDLAEIDSALSLKGRAVRDAWVAQARRFSEAAN